MFDFVFKEGHAEFISAPHRACMRLSKSREIPKQVRDDSKCIKMVNAATLSEVIFKIALLQHL